MQQLQLSQVKFNEEEITEQQEELNQKISLLIETVAIDQITVLFFNREGDAITQPYREFCSIIKNPIPVIKATQIQTIERFAFCFYSMLAQPKTNNMAQIQMHFQGYLHHTTYVSVFVNFHEKIRSWCKELLLDKNFARAKQTLLALSMQIKEAKQKRLEILEWKMAVCLILFEIVAGKNKIQRNAVIKLLKSFKTLKKENKISIMPTLNAFKFMINHFVAIKSDICTFFERQLKLWCQQIIDNQLLVQMKDMIYQCQQMSAETLRLTTNEFIQQKPLIQRKANQMNPSRVGRKIVMNTLNPHLFYQSNPTLITGRRLLRRRPSREKQDEFQKKIDHFFKTRQNNIDSKSLQSTPRQTSRTHLKISIKISQKPSISVHSLSRFTLDQANFLKNTLKSSNEEKKSQLAFRQASRISLSASKSGSSFFNKSSTKKRKQVYQKLVENEGSKKIVTNKHLTSEMLLLFEVQQQRCTITLEEILIGQFKKSQKDLNVKFVGVSEDNEFQDLNLSFFTIFNQQFAQIFFTIQKVGKQGYMLNCKTRSTYCKNPTIFQIEKKENVYQNFTFEDLNESIINSVIYYEALQEKVERNIGVSQIQAMEEILREEMDIELSQSQLTKLLAIVDLFGSYFFWYYTKGNYVNGCRLEKRASIDFQDLSAFAVSLGKFKSDYDSCLNEIVLVENINSLVETCIYLSYGRKVVHKAIRKIKDIFYLEVIQISDSVYKSFSRKDKIPYFKNTELKRRLLKMDDFTSSQQIFRQIKEFQLKVHKKSLNLRDILNEQDVFIFFMKNIVQNFIEIKYIHKLQKHLLSLNRLENYEVFDERQIGYLQKTKLDIVANSEQLNESKQIRPSIHSSIRHLRSILLKYCQVYELDLSFKIVNKAHHLLKIEKTIYTAKQIALSNRIKILQIYKLRKRENYSLFIYHQQPRPIARINTGFHQRFVMVDEQKLVANLIRRQKSQRYLSDDCSSVIKNVIKHKKGYCFINVSQCQSIICWRFDYYFPHLQAQYSTFLDEQIYLECLGQWSQNEQMWKHTIQKINISIQQKCISLHNRKVRLFKSLKRLYFNEKSAVGILQLIELSGQLVYLITNFEQGTLSIGKVENVMFLSNKLIYSSASPNKQKIGMYDNIMNYLYYKILNGKLPSGVIAADYFIHEDQN